MYIALALLRYRLIVSTIIDIIQLIRSTLGHDLLFSNILVRVPILITNYYFLLSQIVILALLCLLRLLARDPLLDLFWYRLIAAILMVNPRGFIML